MDVLLKIVLDSDGREVGEIHPVQWMMTNKGTIREIRKDSLLLSNFDEDSLTIVNEEWRPEDGEELFIPYSCAAICGYFSLGIDHQYESERGVEYFFSYGERLGMLVAPPKLVPPDLDQWVRERSAVCASFKFGYRFGRKMYQERENFLDILYTHIAMSRVGVMEEILKMKEASCKKKKDEE